MIVGHEPDFSRAIFQLTGANAKMAKAGVTATPQSPQSIADAALALAAMTDVERAQMGQAGRAYYLKELSMQKGMESFAKIFEAVTTGKGLQSGTFPLKANDSSSD